MRTFAHSQNSPRQAASRLARPHRAEISSNSGRAETHTPGERQARLLHDFSRTSIFPKPDVLVVASAGDPSEREADRVSEQAMSMQTQPRSTLGEAAGSADLVGTPEPSVAHELLPSSGQPLDAATRSLMESRFRFDFGRVRVYHDQAANQAASGFSARAFTLGRHIAFGPGQYAPETSGGRKLLAHELAHVVQYAQDQSPVLRRAPTLKGKSKHQFGERDASDIDKAIAASPIKNYVPVKDLKKLAGNVDTEDPTVFEKQFKDYGQSQEDVDQVPGFVNRAEKKPIKLRLPGRSSKGDLVVAANFEAAVHETVHLNSKTQFQTNFMHNYNEGVTEYFTELVLGEAGQAYREVLELAKGLISALGGGGEDLVGKAFFQGDKEPYSTILRGFRQDPNQRHLLAWQQASEKKPPDWQTANRLLTNALTSSRTPGGTAPAPAGGTTPTQPPRHEE